MISTAVPALPRPCRFAALMLALPLAAQALCTSEGVPEPTGLLERFTSADCADCWRDPATPRPASGTLALDWIVPGRAGDDAPLAAAGLDEAAQRLRFLKHELPGRAEAVFSAREGGAARLRVAQGESFNDYVGASIELPAPGRDAWQAWLLLVEVLPAGTEGSPVERNLVRNAFRPPGWDVVRRSAGPLAETRSMQIHEGAQPARLRLVAVLQDTRGRLRAIRHTECRE
jgi:hypothetical protein